MEWQLFWQIVALMFFAAMLVIAVAGSIKGKK
jgi:hypothetical protein